MAIYTDLTQHDFEAIATAFGLGTVAHAVFVPQGSINTNVKLETGAGRFFVRHTTVRSPSDLEFEAGVLGLLHEAKVPAPVMRRTLQGAASVELRGGRACVFELIHGEEMTRAQLTPEHLLELGRVLGRFHRAAAAFTAPRENPYGSARVRGWIEGLLGHSDPEVANAAQVLARALPTERPGLIPGGVIHADLFMDNVKWLGTRISALFDFEMACVDALALDLAITLNAWCFEQGQYNWRNARALVDGYRAERPMDPREFDALHGLLLFGAVRFTASRIRDFHLSPLPPEKLARKDFRTWLARVTTLLSLGSDGVKRELQ